MSRRQSRIQTAGTRSRSRTRTRNRTASRNRRQSRSRTASRSRNNRRRSVSRRQSRSRNNRRSASSRQSRSRATTRSRIQRNTRSRNTSNSGRSQGQAASIPYNPSTVTLMDLDLDAQPNAAIANPSAGDQPLVNSAAPSTPPTDPPDPAGDAVVLVNDFTWDWNDAYEACFYFVLIVLFLVFVIFGIPRMVDKTLKYYGFDVRRPFLQQFMRKIT